ncbi:MAG: release factor glutamine methyltransferase [Oceanicoccus sp.]|jgi:release factor glutamine methyltransferase
MEVFLSYLLGCDRLDLIAYPEKEVPVEKLAELQIGWGQIQQGKPVAYLTKTKEFYGLDFYVDENVLVPRGATERLVELVKAKASIDAKVLEIGTGSGAISVSLKRVRPDLKVTAGEVSAGALEVAKKNAKTLKAEVTFIESDLLQSVPKDDYEVLVANLPYIGEVEHHYISDNVETHEPHVALFGGHDGLRLYSDLLEQSKTWNFKWIIGEIGFSQGEDMKKLAKEKLPDYSFELLQDHEGLDRVFVLCYNAGK